MFEREMPGAAMGGGLLHLDQVLGGALARWRASGDFRAETMETLLLERPPNGIRAKTIMLIGLGDPTALQADLLGRATRAAFREASRLRAATVAFAPSLLDTGLLPQAIDGAPAAMMNGLLTAMASKWQLAQAGLSVEPRTSRWSFDAGASRLEDVAAAFKGAFDAFGGDRR
jgi:Cytosol aminopeptidase family, N-terminal domain